jgi:RNA polymerase sigma factor (sigma-70 family)
MAEEAARFILRHLRSLAAAAVSSQVADRELLQRFAEQRDPAAFEELLRRHGALVLRVCRHLLPQRQDVEDVFQATFLTLVRKAESIRSQDAVGSWLHGVARCLAFQVRAANARRRAHEHQTARSLPSDPLSALTLRDAEAVLHEELARLPGKYRLPLELCYLEGARREDAALRLGWSLATLKRRLEQGRELLRVRLTRRGLTLSAALVAVLLAERSAPAAVPVLLARSTIQAARLLTAGQTAAGFISPQAATLLNGGTRTMLLTRLKFGVALLLVPAVLATGAGLAIHQTAGANQAVAAEDSGHAAEGTAPAPPAAAEPHPTDLLGDPLPPGAVARMGTHRLRYEGRVNAVTFTADSGTVVAAGEDQTIRLWDRATGKEVRSLSGHQGAVTGLALSPDGKTLASASRDQTILLWDMPGGKEVGRCLGHKGEVWSIVFAPDGKTMFSGGEDRTVRLWDVRAEKEIRQFQGAKGGISSLALSPDGKIVAAASSETGKGAGLDLAIHLWEVETGKEIRQLAGEGIVTSVAFSPDGKALAAGSTEPDAAGAPTPTVRLWDPATGEERKRWALQGTGIRCLAFAPDGKALAVVVQSTLKADLAPNFTVRLLNADTGEEVRRLGKFFFIVSCAAFSPDGATLAAGGSNKVVSLWGVATGKALHDEGHQGAVTAVAFTPDGKTLFSASYDTTLRAWEAATGKEVRRFSGHEGHVRCLAVSPDGKLLVSGGGTLSNTREKALRLWDVTTGQEREWAAKGRGLVSGVAFSGDGKFVASTGALLDPRTQTTIGQLIQLWDTDTGKEVSALPMPGGGAYEIALSPDGKTLAAGGASRDHLIRLWDTASGKECGRCEGHEAGVNALAFSADGKALASASMDGTVRLWETATGKERAKFAGHDQSANTVAFAPDGKRLASGGADRTIRLWDVGTGKEIQRWTGHASAVRTLAFSPDGTKLASGSYDTTILVWDVRPGKEQDR